MGPALVLVFHPRRVHRRTALDHCGITADGWVEGIKRAGVGGKAIVIAANQILALIARDKLTDVCVAGIVDIGGNLSVQERPGIDKV